MSNVHLFLSDLTYNDMSAVAGTKTYQQTMYETLHSEVPTI